MSWGFKHRPGQSGGPMSGWGSGDRYRRRSNNAARTQRMTRPSRRVVRRSTRNQDPRGPR